MKAHADLLRRFDAVIEPHAVGVEVEVVGAGGTARQQQLGHRYLRAHLHHLGRQARPDRVERLEPAEQLGVLRRRYRPGQRLVHVVMGVDQPRRDQVATGVDHLIDLGHRVSRQLVERADRLNHAAPDQHAGPTQLAPGLVHGGDEGGVADEEGAVWISHGELGRGIRGRKSGRALQQFGRDGDGDHARLLAADAG